MLDTPGLRPKLSPRPGPDTTTIHPTANCTGSSAVSRPAEPIVSTVPFECSKPSSRVFTRPVRRGAGVSASCAGASRSGAPDLRASSSCKSETTSHMFLIDVSRATASSPFRVRNGPEHHPMPADGRTQHSQFSRNPEAFQ